MQVVRTVRVYEYTVYPDEYYECTSTNTVRTYLL